MVSQISQHLDTHKILLKNQHGFLSRLSCETQWLEFVQEPHDNLNNGQQVDALIMDFSKAFDKVAHNRLLHKLDNYGISGKANRWIADFLSGRSQQVVVEGCASGKVLVTSGVPQGSVLGPVIFLVYINGITDKTSSAVRLFADDTIIYRPITTVNDQTTQQKDLNVLDHWSRVWQMEFHPSKCQTLHITRSPKPLLTNYKLYGQQIEGVDSAKYLGVTLTPDLRWNNYVHSVRNKSSATMRLLQRNMRISSTQIKTRAYNTYVRPQLEYAATIWDPHTKQNIKKLEQVQRTAARWTLGRYRNTSSVSDMLNELGWRSLEQRRADARLIMMYKLRNNMLAIDPSPYLKPAQGSIARVYPHRYITLDTNTKIYARSFYPNTIRQWNCLPPMLHWHPHLTHSSARCVNCNIHTETTARAPANYWRVLGWGMGPQGFEHWGSEGFTEMCYEFCVFTCTFTYSDLQLKPPPSFYALLSLFFLPCMPVHNGHCYDRAQYWKIDSNARVSSSCGLELLL